MAKKLIDTWYFAHTSNGARIQEGFDTVRITRSGDGSDLIELHTGGFNWSEIKPVFTQIEIEVPDEEEPSPDPDPSPEPDPDPTPDPDPSPDPDPTPTSDYPTSGDYTVHNATEMWAALNGQSGGATILLAPGHYGDLTFGSWYGKRVNLVSTVPGGATFGTLKLSLSGEAWGLRVDGRFTGDSCRDALFAECVFNSWAEILFGENVRVRDCRGKTTLFWREVAGFECIGNRLESPGGYEGDRIVIAGECYDGIIANNYCGDLKPRYYDGGTYTHSDGIQFFNMAGKPWPHDIVVEGNVIWDDPSTNEGSLFTQGIAVGGPRITIRRNLVMVNSPNSIIMANDGTGTAEIYENTVIPCPNGQGGRIRVYPTANGTHVFDNACVEVVEHQGASAEIGYNFTFSVSEAFDLFEYSRDAGGKLVSRGDWREFIPKGAAVGKGAQARIDDLLAA
ncbi:hypothetical protein [Psychromarinibacter halotolerans]|uniref:Right handed beta helix domain-containing protein n=1 Tax=Psychromarinibacter halotolerans TaxID=1775175 RepID=A0ABV7GYL1_9RHOB|nr:hypothetical protein [Psychromarinibacter halotolerans]MDF0598447.1 hypothetical protein [Psychromarinibacter halotolerans]